MRRSGSRAGGIIEISHYLQKSVPLVFGLLLLLGGMCVSSAAPAGGALQAWRAAADAVRMLAENNAPRAHAEALHLQATLPADAVPADRAKVWNVLARAEIYLAQSEPAGKHAQAALELASRHGDRVGQAEAELNIALNAVNQGRIDLLSAATTHSVAVLEGVDRPDLLSEALLRTAMMYHRMGQLEESITMTMQTLEIANATKDPLALTYAHQGLGVSMVLNERFKEGRVHYQQMREQARAAGSKILEAYALNGIGNIDGTLGEPEKAEASIRKAIGLFRAVGAPLGISHALYALAELFRSQGRHADALPLLNEVVALYEKHVNAIGLWYTLNTRSAVYVALGNQAAALADAERAYGLARQIGLPSYQSESAQRTAAIVAAQGDYRRAYDLSVEAATLTASAARKRANVRVVELAQRFETESKKRQIAELTRRNEQQMAELRQRELQQRWLWTVLAGSIALLALTAFFLLRQRRTHAIIRNLNASLEQRVHARTAQLRQQTRYLRTLIDTLPWRVWLKDTSSRYLAVNQAAADTCGLSADDLIGKSELDVRPQALADAFRADDLAVMTSRRRKTVEERQSMADGAAVWTETFKAPVLDEDGSVLGTVGFAHDISERKAAETAREAELAEAQRLARVRSEFLAQMSHELRTPLNGILGHAQILRRDKNLDEQQRAGVYVIQQSGDHLLTLINDILDMAKIEAGKLELYVSDVPLTRCLQTVVEIVRVKAEQKQLDFICDIDPDLPGMVRADDRRLRQVLLNLLANAVKFTDHGHVTMRARFTPPDRFRFEVEDTGIGIGQAQLESIFEPFEQTGEAQRRVGGTGLGLAITRQFVRLMGGDIHVASAPGKGSTFWFELELPVAAAGMQAAPFEQVVIGYAGPRKTILVVDDVAENRTVAVAMLGRLGFHLAESPDGGDAVERAQAVRPDLILMDIVMPRMDGVEATRRLRALPGLAEVPIIAVSASALSQDEERCLAADVNAFLPKPLDHDRLVSHIARLLQLPLIYEPSARPMPDETERATLVLPPKEQIDALYALARLGNMQELLRWAEQLEELDDRYRPFADQLQVLAKAYQSKAILMLAKRCLEHSEIVGPTQPLGNK